MNYDLPTCALCLKDTQINPGDIFCADCLDGEEII